MQFSTKEDIDASAEQVFRAVSDFDGFERSALRRGAQVRRKESLSAPEAELGWDVAFVFRGKLRNVSAELIRFDPPNGLGVLSQANGINGDMVVELLPMSPTRTRLHVTLDLKPRSMSGRIMLQSMKLVKNNLRRRFKNRVAQFAIDVEARA